MKRCRPSSCRRSLYDTFVLWFLSQYVGPAASLDLVRLYLTVSMKPCECFRLTYALAVWQLYMCVTDRASNHALAGAISCLALPALFQSIDVPSSDGSV